MCMYVREPVSVLPALTFPQFLPHTAVTVSHIEMSEDYMVSPAEPKSSVQGCLVCLVQSMNTLAESIKSQISHMLYKAERFLILHCLSA